MSPLDVQSWRDGPYEISTERSRLDVDLIHGFLSRELWDSAGIPRDRVLQRDAWTGSAEELPCER